MNLDKAIQADWNEIQPYIAKGLTEECEVVIDGKYVLDGHWDPCGYVWYNFGGVTWKASAPEYSQVFTLGDNE